MEETTVGDRQQALAAVRQAAESDQPFDLVIIDAALPNGDAFEIAAEFSAFPKHGHGRLVLLTPLDFTDDAAGLHRAGFHAQLTKPLKILPLLDCMARVLNGQTLPLPVEERRPTDSDAKETAAVALKILVAEDSPVNQKVILFQLQKLGYSADLVIDGEAVVQAVLARHYDVVLLDCQMPRLDGYEATQRIRSSEHDRRTWIIAMTAHALTGDRERCLAVGMDDYIGKPVRLGDLRSALERHAVAEARHPLVPPVNRAVLEDLREAGAAGTSMLAELIEVFLGASPQVLAELRAASNAGNTVLLGQSAHLLRGSSVNFGAERLCAICEHLERTAAEESLDICRTLVEDAEREFDRVRQVLERELAACAT
jgi:CheY-like chemotaxis protein/HPt (histidine-containing phosphotransfer) domain-containing protein